MNTLQKNFGKIIINSTYGFSSLYDENINKKISEESIIMYKLMEKQYNQYLRKEKIKNILKNNEE